MVFISCSLLAEPYAKLEGNILKIGNGEIERKFDFNAGDLKTLSITDKKSGTTTLSDGKRPDLLIPGETQKASGGYFKKRVVEDSEIRKGWLECETG